jgi:antitoxin ParD1/3/4
MSVTQKRDVSVAPDLVDLLEDAVASGEYSTASDVVNDALRVWRESRDTKRIDVETLRRLCHEGLESGPAVDAETEFKRLREKYAKAIPPA